MPRVSVVIPTFNRLGSTGRAVASALAQTITDLEILVVDDGSIPALDTDHLPCDARVRIVRHALNRGAAAARNTGMREAKGEWIAFLDSDDVWQPDKLALQLEEAERHADKATAIATGWRYREKDGLGEPVIPLPATEASAFAAGCWFCPGTTLLIRRDQALAIGGQDESLRRLEDYDWFLHFGANGGKIVVVPQALAEIHHYSGYTAGDVRAAAALIEEKFCGVQSVLRLPSAAMRRRVKAYLALTCAAASWHSDERVRGLATLAWSILLQPRLRVQNGKFWR